MFNDVVTIVHNGTNRKAFRMGMTNGDEFNDTLSITNSSNGRLSLSEADTTFFNGPLELNNNGAGTIHFSYSGGLSELTSGNTISVGATGFATNELILYNFKQSGTTDQTITLTGTAKIYLNNCEFNGAVTITASNLFCGNSIFNSDCELIRTGSNTNYWYGNNIFNGAATIVNQGTGGSGNELRLAATSPNFGGEFNINNSILNKNNIGIQLGSFSGVHSGTFSNGSQIKCSSHYSNLIPGTLKTPFPPGTISERGVFCPNSGPTGSWIIGNHLTNGNIFFNLSSGIKIEDWKLDIRNSQFYDCGTGIQGVHNYLNGPSVGGQLIIGVGGSAFGNSFQNCDNGISVTRFSLYAENNTFLNDQYDIQISNSSISNNPTDDIEIEIVNNAFTDFFRGIYANSVTHTDIFDIKLNVFNRSLTLGNGSTAIWISGSSGQVMNNLDIDDNEFNNVRWGILLNSVIPPLNTFIKPINVVKNNVFNFYNTNVPNSTPDFYGIRMENCRGVWIGENKFYRFNGNAQNEEFDMYAIYANGSEGCPIVTNEIYDYGTGMLFRGNCQGTRLHCNEYNDNWQSVRFGQAGAAASFTNQGTPSLAWDNVWVNNNSAFRITGPISIINWYQRTGSQYEPTNNNLVSTICCINATTTCPINPPAFVSDRNNEYRLIIQDSILYDNFSSEMNWYSKSFVYWALLDDTSSIVQNIPDDSIYVDFINQIDTTNIGKFFEVEQLIQNNDLESASALNESINDTNQIESNLKSFYSIYFNSIFIGEELTQTQYDSILDIAEQKPLLGGRAVWLSRHLLELDIEDLYDEERMANSAIHQDTNAINDYYMRVSIVNPASNILSIQTDVLCMNCTLKIYDCFGKLVLEQMLRNNETLLDITGYSDGIYFYNIYSTEAKEKNGKIIISNY